MAVRAVVVAYCVAEVVRNVLDGLNVRLARIFVVGCSVLCNVWIL